MLRCFVTGDNHFGRKYDSFSGDVKDAVLEARFTSLKKMVDEANKQQCDLFIITGDLFEKTFADYVQKEVIERVITILSGFHNRVLVLPGNHDYYDDRSSVWHYFIDTVLRRGYSNIILLSKFEPYLLGQINGTSVTIFPAYCDSEHSHINKLGWIKGYPILKEDTINIGVAHGTLEGLSCDNEGEYFLMTPQELLSIPVDAWFIGHAHVPYPSNISYDFSSVGTIFNPGTHQQTHIGNHTDGYGFVVEITKTGDKADVTAKKVHSGTIHFREIEFHVSPSSDDALKQALQKELDTLQASIPSFESAKTIIRVAPSGVIKSDDYGKRDDTVSELTSSFLFTYPSKWSSLIEEISPNRITTEFDPKSFIAQFLTGLITNEDGTASTSEQQIELSMAYGLINSLRKDK